MDIRRNVVLAVAGICLLAAGGCSTTGGGVHVRGGQPKVVTAKPGPPPHAPAHGYRAKHQYRYYPQEQVYFDPVRRVFFYLEGPNWRMSASLPAPLQIRRSHYVIVEVEHHEPTVEFEKHKAKHPRKEKAQKLKNNGGGGQPTVVIIQPAPPQAPTHGSRASHQYRYYPQEQVYFDPGLQVFFYLDGPNWRMNASLPRSLQVNHSQYVTIEVEHQQPYLEFENHKAKHPRKEKAKTQNDQKFKNNSGGGQPTVVIVQPAPPPQAPTHGSRASHQYRYYPQEQVYFDPGRQVFFYLDGPNWRMNASLPGPLQVNHSQYVTVEVEHQQPYLEFENHKAKHPKDKDKDKGKGKGNKKN
jgi:hypothetical protein